MKTLNEESLAYNLRTLKSSLKSDILLIEEIEKQINKLQLQSLGED